MSEATKALQQHYDRGMFEVFDAAMVEGEMSDKPTVNGFDIPEGMPITSNWGTEYGSLSGEREKERGLSRASHSRKEVLTFARTMAEVIARRNGTVTIDDVQRELEANNLSSEDLGCAAGAVFSSKKFCCVGWKQSNRIKAHRRSVRVWELWP